VHVCRYVGVFSAVYAGSRAAAPRADELMEHTTADDIEATLLKVLLVLLLLLLLLLEIFFRTAFRSCRSSSTSTL
jgi:hypothetical protein